MKRIFFLCMGLFTAAMLFAQSPSAFNYQAVVRDAAGAIKANQSVNFRISILEGSASGSAVLQETHPVSTNGFGLVNLEIGNGHNISGNIASINWSGSTHFLKIELDPTGGSSFTLMGTTQLLSVPYALHAKTVQIDQVDDADHDPANEIQEIQLSGTVLTLTKGGGTVTLPSIGGGDNWGTQAVLTDATLTGNGTTASPLIIADNGVNSAKIQDGSIVTADLADQTVSTAKLGNLAVSADKIQNGAVSSDKLAANAVITEKLSANSVTVAKLPAGATADKYLRGDGTWAIPSSGVTETDPTWAGAANEASDIGRTGRVGIGTITPEGILHVNGNSNWTFGQLLLTESENDGARILFNNSVQSGKQWSIVANLTEPDDNSYLAFFYKSGSWNYNRASITGTGNFQISRDLYVGRNVGIGVSQVPTVSLEVGGQVKISGGSPGAGKILTSDASGLATWQTPASGLWQTSGSNVYYNSGNAGIGTASPSALLHTQGTGTGQGNIVFVGEFKGSNPGNPPVSGAGTRMMWYPDKAAFRAGYANGSDWDAGNIGNYSTAIGLSGTASGLGSISIGCLNSASGYYSIAMGIGCNASQAASIAMGDNCIASQTASVAMGMGNTSSGRSSTAMGEGTTIASCYATAIGKHNVGGGNSTTWLGTDPLFEIGNGTSSALRSNAMTVLKNGYVGFGTATPSAGLHIKAITWPGSFIYLESNTGQDAGMRFYEGSTDKWHIYNSSADGGLRIANTAAQTAIFAKQSNSYVGIGNNSPAYPLDVAGPANFNKGIASGVALRCDGKEALWFDGTCFSWGFEGTYNYFADKVTIGNAANPGSYMLYVQGNAYITGTWSSSDARYKKNISTINNPLEKILKVRGTSFEFRQDEFKDYQFADGTQFGFIAQELENIFPEMVNTDSNGYKSVNYNGMIPVLLEALKEQQRIIDGMKAEMTQLKTGYESRLDRLEKLISQAR